MALQQQLQLLLLAARLAPLQQEEQEAAEVSLAPSLKQAQQQPCPCRWQPLSLRALLQQWQPCRAAPVAWASASPSD